MGEKNGHYCVDGQMWGIGDDGYPTLTHAPSSLNVTKAFMELFRDSDMRPEDECHVLYDAAEEAVGKESVEVAALRARVEKLEKVLDEAYGELSGDSLRDAPRCLLLTRVEAALAGCEEVGRG